MSTINPRLNITIEPAIADILSELASHEHRSISSFAKELIIEALERREDIALSALAKLRDVPGSKTISHEDAWK